VGRRDVDQNKGAIHKRVVAQIKRQEAVAVTPAEKPDEANPSGSTNLQWLLILTLALCGCSTPVRQGTAFHTAGSGDEGATTAPALCVTDFIDADQDLTKLYLDLAERHTRWSIRSRVSKPSRRPGLGIKDEPPAIAVPD